MESESLFERVRRLGGFRDYRQARAATRATLAIIGERLRDDERARLAADLPSGLRTSMRRSRYRGDFDIAEMVDRVRRREGQGTGFAREHVQVVCRALGEVMAEETVSWLDRVLSKSISELFHAPATGERPSDPPRVPVERRDTLASGRPGSSHPLSESNPERTQSHSIVLEGNPHAETKLSSTSGTTQERLRESLATAAFAARRTLSEVKE